MECLPHYMARKRRENAFREACRYLAKKVPLCASCELGVAPGPNQKRICRDSGRETCPFRKEWPLL